ncbi:MAG: YeeE/YedE family protein [Acidobacteria bacterium]|nr:YeeE/YedE family protein [Acidobacteriota bacterium]
MNHAASESGRRSFVQYRGPAVVAAAIAVLAAWLGASFGARQSALMLVGVAAGLVLYHAAFGFTSSWRTFIATGRGAGLRAQMLMLATACLVFFPLLATGEFHGQPLRGFVSPVGVSVVVGAFMFGVGMQLGGGCASGTLYTAGGGNTRMLVTLTAFIVGSVIGTVHGPWWTATPAFAPISLIQRHGAPVALGLSLLLFAAIASFTIAIERRRHGSFESLSGQAGDDVRHRWLHGPWPLVAGALGLAAVNIATLLLAGRPWGVTGAFALWGAKALASAGVPIHTWPSFATPAQRAALDASVLADVTSVMNVGIVLGALTAAMLAGRFAPVWRVPARSLVAAVVGGLLLGYGARIAYGCNIGAYFSGIASGSLHGWLWLVAAFAGNVIGVRLRPYCGLSAR